MGQDTQNFLNLIHRNSDRALMTVDIGKIEQGQAVRRAAADKENFKPVPARVEFNLLREKLFSLQEWANNAAIYFNNKVGEVKLLEQRITDLLRQKKAATEADNPLTERFYEHQIQRLETELADVRPEANRAWHQNTNAVRGLKAFDGHARIKELKKELDRPIAEVKP